MDGHLTSDVFIYGNNKRLEKSPLHPFKKHDQEKMV